MSKRKRNDGRQNRGVDRQTNKPAGDAIKTYPADATTAAAAAALPTDKVVDPADAPAAAAAAAQAAEDREDALDRDDDAGRGGRGRDDDDDQDGPDDDDGPPPPESQRERWLKYGSNVLVVVLVAIVLAGLVTYLAQKAHARLDTTKAKVYSLKPQTVKILRDLDQPVRIVSLYTKPDQVQATPGQDDQDYAGTVADLLAEYKSNSSKVSVEVIDPLKQPSKVDDLITEVTEKYGGEVKKYKDFLAKWPDQYKQFQTMAAREAAEAERLQQSLEQEGAGDIGEAVRSVDSVTKELGDLQTQIDKAMKQRPPNYKGATDAIRRKLDSDVSPLLGQMIAAFERVPGMVPKTQPATQPSTQPSTGPTTAPSATPELTERERRLLERIPAPILAYLRESLPRYREMKRLSDEVSKQIAGLGDLKLDDLRQQLRERDAILVLGPDEMRSLPFQQVWQIDPDVRQFLRAGGTTETIKPKFAGEQQVTTAVLAVTTKKKPKVVFVRPGGPPFTSSGSPFQRSGPYNRVAQRLREYNFDVKEKDLSGMWAMQNRGMMPPEPEPTDEEMKDAVWVVIDVPNQQQGMMPTSAPVAERLAAHLDAGGSALVLAVPRAPDLASALDKWGLKLRVDASAAHDVPPATGAPDADLVQQLMRRPDLFVTNQYGNHMITKPIRSLDTVTVFDVPVQITSPAPQGVTVTPLLSTPAGLNSWGETSVDQMDEGPPKFDPATDIPGPINIAAAAEKAGAGRLVVIGSVPFASNDALSIPDFELAKKGVIVSRFPGNAELFTNSVFWLARMDTLIAISPSAMEVNRIDDMGKTTLGLWRVGVLVVGLPLAVLLAGGLVYLRRRD